jgi:hypothetical protein
MTGEARGKSQLGAQRLFDLLCVVAIRHRQQRKRD